MASVGELEDRIGKLWAERDSLSPESADAAAVIHQVVDLVDRGEVRVAEPAGEGEVLVHEWVKQAILLLFKVSAMETVEAGPFEYADKLPLKRDFAARGVRAVPGASARWGAHLGRGVVLMPSYVNIGAWVGEGTMVDTWATVGSCAQVGANTHLSGGVGIGGVLEPPQAAPVVVGGECFIGSRCIVAEGAVVGDGVVLGAGAILTGSVPVIDAETGEELSRGKVPSWCVAIPASRKRTYPGGEFSLPCVLVVRRLTAGERHDKAALNSVLREHGATV